MRDANASTDKVKAIAAAPVATTEQTAERELLVKIWRDEFAQFEGTSAQLIAEGLIPEGFAWPRAAAYKHWKANGFDYRVCRTRPEGHKGPMRTWLEMDNWSIRVNVTGRDHAWSTRRALERKAEELRAEYYRHTAEGSREWSANWDRYWKARQDKAFQAFKNLIPGLVPPKRGRKAKASKDQGDGAPQHDRSARAG